MYGDIRDAKMPISTEAQEKFAAQNATVHAQEARVARAAGLAGEYVARNSFQYTAPPRLGETVLVDIGREINGSRIHPAIVTRVWGPDCINAKALVDGPENLWLVSIMHKSKVPAPQSYMQPRPTYWYRDHDGPPLT